MTFEGDISVRAPHRKVWDFFQSVDELARCIPGCQSVEQVDDTHYRIFNLIKTTTPDKPPRGSLYDGKRWSELTEAEHQRLPGDYEAQVGQGPISLHSEEHLTTTDKGIGMVRHTLAQQIKIVQDGGDPVGVAFHPADQVVVLEAGNFFE